MNNGANYQRGKLHHSPWHSDIRTSNQLNIRLNEDDYSAFRHTCNLLTLRPDLVHMVEIFECTYVTTWILIRMSWMRNGEKVELYLQNLVKRSTCSQLLAESAEM